MKYLDEADAISEYNSKIDEGVNNPNFIIVKRY